MNGETKNGLVLGTVEEKKLEKEVSVVEKQASEVEIKTEADYQYAGELTKQVKAAQKKVEEYWEPMRASTYAAYKSVTDHKKDMIDPLKNAEGILKKKISGYLMEVEKKRREEEEALRRQAEAEMQKKLAEAEAAEKNGDADAVEYAMAEAEVMEQVAASATVQVQETKVQGVSKKLDWKITKIDEAKVPIDVAGIVVRPVDEKAIMNLIKSTKGKIKIPGVTYEETYNISVRA